MKALTIRQQELLTLIARCWKEEAAPVVMELARQMGLSAEPSLTPILKALEKKGYIAIQGGIRGRQRLIQLTAKGKIATQRPGLPVLGCIIAGPLSEALQQAEAFVENLDDVLPYQPGDFLLVVRGDSMIGDGIYEGDKVLLRPNVQIYNGEIAAVHVGEDYCATLKRVYFKAGRKMLYLRASNPAYEDTVRPAADVKIAGVFRGLVRTGMRKLADKVSQVCKFSLNMAVRT
ncbi:MAG: transcriptional repressor LexA [Armatimonadota bacterium]|nr:transcriptional repressor LexA [Armatimonadota bacterium]